ncbi:hypothetical protein [Rhizobium sp. SG2393]
MQALIIAVLLSLIAWVGAFDVARLGYRDAERDHLIPNLHVRERLSLL